MKKINRTLRRMSVCRVALALTVLALTGSFNLPLHVQAAAGDLDTTFGSGGIVITSMATATSAFVFDELSALATQSDGKITVAA